MKKVFLFILLLTLLISKTFAKVQLSQEELNWLAEHKTIRIGSDYKTPPFSFMKNTQYCGVFSDYLKYFSEELGINFEFVTKLNWSENLEKIKNKDIDMIPAIVNTATRREYINFSENIASFPTVIFVRNDRNDISSLNDFKTKKLAVPRNFYTHEDLKKNHPDIQLYLVNSPLDGLKAVLFGKAEGYVGHLGVATYHMQNENINNLKIASEYSHESTKVHFGIRKDWVIFRNIIDKTIKNMPEFQRIQILKKWMPIVLNSEELEKEKNSTLTLSEKEWLEKQEEIKSLDKWEQFTDNSKNIIQLSKEEINWLKYNSTIKIAGNPDLLPQEPFSETGRPTGIVPELLKLIESKLPLKFEIVNSNSLTEAFNKAKNKKVDILSTVPNREREQFLNFTEPYLSLPIVIITRRNYKIIDSLANLNGKKVGIPKNYSYGQQLKNTYPNIEFIVFEDIQKGLETVSTGKNDAFISTIACFISKNDENNFSNLVINNKIGIDMNLGLGVRDDWPILAQILDKAINSISEDEKNSIIKKWIGTHDISFNSNQNYSVSADSIRLVLQFTTLLIAIITVIIIITGQTLGESNSKFIGYDSRKLRNFVTIIISIIMTVIIIATWFILKKIKETTKERVKYSVETTIETTNNSINTWLENNIRSYEIRVSQAEFIEITEALLALESKKNKLIDSSELINFREYLKRNFYDFNFSDYYIVSPDSINLASKTDFDLGEINIIKSKRGELLTKVFQGNSQFIPPIKLDNNKSSLFFAIPIRDKDGKVIAAFIREENPIENFDRFTSFASIGKTGETYAFDDKGLMVSESRFHNQLVEIGLLEKGDSSIQNIALKNPEVNLTKGEKQIKTPSQQDFTLMAKNALLGYNGYYLDGYLNYKGVKVFGIWIWNNRYNFGLATEINYHEALQPYFSGRVIIILIVGLTVVLSMGLTIFSIYIGERANKALSKSNEKLEERVNERTKQLSQLSQAVEQSPSTIVITDKSGIIEYTNPKFTKISGYTSEEAKGNNPRILKAEHFPKSHYRNLWKTILNKEVWHGELYNQKKNGEKYWEDASIAPILDEAGEITHFIAVKNDITEKKLVEKVVELQQIQVADVSKNLQATLEALTHPFYVIDVETYEIVLANNAAKNLNKNPKPTCYAHTHGRDTPCSGENHPCPLNVIKESLKPYHVQHVDYDEHNNAKYIEYHGYPIFDDKGKLTRMIEYSQDITERKISEDKTRRAFERIQLLYDTSLSLQKTNEAQEVFEIILTKLNHIIPYDSATIQELSNENFKILYAKGFEDNSKILNLEFPLKPGNLSYEVYRTKKPVIVGNLDNRDDFLSKSESPEIKSWMGIPLIINNQLVGKITFDSRKYNFYNENMAKSAISFVNQAAVAIKNTQYLEELKKAKEIAEAATKAKGDFLANMSHEIRTPMNAIIGLNSLLERTKLNAKQKDYVSKIERASSNLLGIINDILDFSKIEAGKLNMEKIDFDLQDVLDNMAGVLRLKAYEKEIEFLIIKDSDVPVNLIGDPLRLGQILLNLVSNSIKFTKKGEITVRVKTEKIMGDKVSLFFSVEDTGIGMTEEQISKLFKAFSQADTSTTRKFGGTGLGLTISKTLSELMNGNIGVESKYGIGSTFYFTAEFELGKETKEKENIIPSLLKNLNVLIVDDNDSAKEILENYLADFSYSPVLVSSGEEAISKIKVHKFDLIIMDWKMPGLNGLDTIKQIKKIIPSEEMPKFILVTAYEKNEIEEQATEEGIDELLSKPISQSELFDSIISSFGENTDTEQDKRKGENIYPENFDSIRGAKILLVEDNEINQQVATEILESEGFWIDVAENGQIALNKVEENNYDLVFMDLQMPILDGYKAAKYIRRLTGKESLAIVALSADAIAGTRQRVLEAGMNDFITKPIEKKDLFGVMSKWITAEKRKLFISNDNEDQLISQEEIAKVLKNIDVKDAVSRVSGNVEFYINILKKFKGKNDNFINSINELINKGKNDESIRAAHSIKGVAGNIGAKTLNYYSSELEKELGKKDCKPEVVKHILSNIDTELKIILGQIDTVLNDVESKKTDSIDEFFDINHEEVLEKLNQMKELLEDGDTDAEEIFIDLKPFMNKLDLAEKFNTLGEYLDSYEFDDAAKICTEIIKQFS